MFKITSSKPPNFFAPDSVPRHMLITHQLQAMTPSLLYLLTVLLFATHVYPQIFPPIKPKYGYYPQRNPKGILSSADLILNTMQNSQLRTWGFVIIRCTYANEAKWEAFLTEIKERTLAKPGTNYGPSLASANRLNERLRWTILEDQESLDGASMKVASEKFVEWVETGGREEVGACFSLLPSQLLALTWIKA